MGTQEEREDRLVIRRVIHASREEVFAAWIDPESMRHWMCPGGILTAETQLDPRIGGSFRIVMKGPGRSVEHTGEYRIIDPPSKLVFTWRSARTNFEPTLVTVELLERGDGCELVLTHERLPGADAVASHKDGWTTIAARLAGHLRQAAREPRGSSAPASPADGR